MPLLKGIGKQLQIGISRESTRGTASSTATVYWLATDDYSVDEKYSNAVDSQVYGLIEDNVSQTRVKNWSEGSFKLPFGDASAPLLFYSLFGTLTTTTASGETTVKNHAFTVAQTVQHQSLTISIHDPIPTPASTTADYTYKNSVINKMDIDYALGKFIDVTIGSKGLAGSMVGTVFVPAQTAENRWVPQYLTFSVASSVSGLAGATPIKIKSAKITIDENEEDDDVMGSTSPRDFLNKEFQAEGTVEAIWQNESDFRTAAIANTAQALRFNLVNSDVSIGVVPSRPTLVMDFASVYFTEFSRPVKIKEIMYQTIKFKAAYSLSAAFMVRGTITNTVASY